MIDFIVTKTGQVYDASLTGMQALLRRMPVYPCLTVVEQTETNITVRNLYRQEHSYGERDDGVLLYDGKPYGARS